MAKTKRKTRVLDALPDTVDFRDIIYVPSLIEIPPISDIDGYRKAGIPVLDQGREGACTGYALATVANYLLAGRGRRPLADGASAWMLYTMAKRYDEWPGEAYDGSSARGAMKGWHKHGVCAERLWKDATAGADLDEERAADALARPLGAYFRVNHKDIVAMHSAVSEVGVLSATAHVHSGWMDVRTGDEEIEHRPDHVGGHAFAIVGYDKEGFWIQNSWGPSWGSGGLARLTYTDWLENGTDVWVAALGAPISLRHQSTASASMRSGAPRSYEGYVYSVLRPHIVTSRNDGELDPKGEFGLTPEGLRNVIEDQMPARMKDWQTKRVALHAHGGLVSAGTAIQNVAAHREAVLNAEVYPLSFIWKSDAWSTIGNILRDAFSKRRDEGLLDRSKDFMLDRLDDTLEPLARGLGGKALWDEMKENAQRATTGRKGAARAVADLLAPLRHRGVVEEIHLVGHSAGAVFLAPLARRFAAAEVAIDSVSLWAPACTIDLFNQVYRPMIESGAIRSFELYTLDDATERDDDCRDIYHKSLLYLISHAFERRPRIPLVRPGEPLLGLQKSVERHIPDAFWEGERANWHIAPASPNSNASHHGDFDNDRETLKATLRHITGGASRTAPAPMSAAPSRDALVRKRLQLEAALRR